MKNKRETKIVNVRRKPSVDWLHQNTNYVYGDLSALDAVQFIKTWKAVLIARYLLLKDIKPSGYIDSRHRHLLAQMGYIDHVKKVRAEFTRREMDGQYVLFIELLDTAKKLDL